MWVRADVIVSQVDVQRRTVHVIAQDGEEYGPVAIQKLFCVVFGNLPWADTSLHGQGLDVVEYDVRSFFRRLSRKQHRKDI